jgi:hypothetical protein
MRRRLISNLLGLVGAIVGSVLGFYTVKWLLDHGFYGLIVPGAFLGLGCSLLAQHHSVARGILCGVAALGVGLYSDWRLAWPGAGGMSQYMSDLTGRPVTLLMLGIGALIASWVGKDSGFQWYAGKPGPIRVESDEQPPKTE